jgi:hypothetical protein
LFKVAKEKFTGQLIKEAPGSFYPHSCKKLNSKQSTQIKR